jgi:mannose-6-phosphate isomerase class I
VKTQAAFRKTTQDLMPAQANETQPGEYNIYPGFPMGEGTIWSGHREFAEKIRSASVVVLDGFPGVLWDNLCECLTIELDALGTRATWQDVSSAMRSVQEVESLIAPYLGGNDPLFGRRFQGTLADFFEPEKLSALQPDPSASLNILYGCGATLAGWEGLLVYVDVPKNEIQFRFRQGVLTNLGSREPLPSKLAYKRSYFVDWVAASNHKREIFPKIDIFVDEQRPDLPTLALGKDVRESLHRMSKNYFRVRPWFEPGPWGGQWIRKNIPQLPQDVPNYAWSFELIVPENGLVFETNGLRLEVSFDCLMFQEYTNVLGDCAERFQTEFPIRLDFLDTFDGGNLSIQCHPRPEYIRQHFGETFTQDETYYILDCEPGARVYLGFQEDIEPNAFRVALEDSAQTAVPLEIDRFVQSLPVQKHDLLLIPNGTIHGSGRDNLVLEISATPYIFTFKLYDWLRNDLDGKPRTLNIQRAFENLYFDRKGERIPREFVSKPYVLDQGTSWKLLHCPTHPEHFYDVHRLEFDDRVTVPLQGSCHALSLVEGASVLLETAAGMHQRFNYAETFVVPAAAGSYQLVSENGKPLKVIKCFVKPESAWMSGVLP